MAVAALLLIVGHMLSTATFDLVFWTLICYPVARQSGGADGRGWLLVGLATGLALQNKTLPAFLVAAVLIGLLLGGPRAVDNQLGLDNHEQGRQIWICRICAERGPILASVPQPPMTVSRC